MKPCQAPETHGESWIFSDDDLAMMLDGSAVTISAPPTTSVDARALARNLAAQYAEVVTHYATDIVAGRNLKMAPRLQRVLADARRLASEMEDDELLRHYDSLERLVMAAPAGPLVAADQREAASQALGEWVMVFADLVGGETGKRLVRDVVIRKGSNPLISHLREIRGLGEKRLERLYAAGLLTTETLVEADPAELATIVGLPINLAETIVDAARRFADDQRRRAVVSLRQAAIDVMRNIRDIQPNDADFRKLLGSIKDTLARLENTIREFEGTP